MFGLIFDTSRNPAFILLAKGKDVYASKQLLDQKKLSEALFPAFETLLKETRLTLQDISYISVGIGPGSYIGMRTAATIAKTLSYTHQIPLIEFYSPLAFIPPGHTESFTFVGDAKMGSFYVLTEKTKPVLCSLEELQLHLQNKNFILSDKQIEQITHPPQLNLAFIAAFSYEKFIKGNILSHQNLQLSYLRY